MSGTAFLAGDAPGLRFVQGFGAVSAGCPLLCVAPMGTHRCKGCPRTCPLGYACASGSNSSFTSLNGVVSPQLYLLLSCFHKSNF